MTRFFDEKTGDPATDNRNRNLNRRITKKLRRLRFHTPSGWQRKAYLKRVEGTHYGQLIAATAVQLANQQQTTDHQPSSG